MWVVEEKKMIISYKKLWTENLHPTIYNQLLKHVIKLSIQWMYSWINMNELLVNFDPSILLCPFKIQTISGWYEIKIKWIYMWILVIQIVAVQKRQYIKLY